MSKLSDLLKSHTKSHTLKKYSNVRIYPAIIAKKSTFTKEEKERLTRKGFRWYIYYDFLNPDTGKMERQPAIHQSVNREFPEFDERRKNIFLLKEALEELLEDGFSPYSSTNLTNPNSAFSCFDFALDIKKQSVSETTYLDYDSRLKLFKDYLTIKRLHKVSIDQIGRSIVNNYLNHVLKSSSPRNRNNTKAALSALFTVLEENDLIENNFIRNIRNIKAKPTRNKSYSPSRLNEVYNYITHKDPYLLMFVKVVSYNFLRPVEVVRLRCGDLDLSNKRLTVKSKTKEVKTKVIPEILIEELKSFDLSNPDYFLFTPNDQPGKWSLSDNARRSYFTLRFKRRIKEPLGLGDDYTIYSFRHTFTGKLYKWLRTQYHITEALDRLQLITGHESRAGLMNYLRSIDAELPEDYSEGLK